MPIRANVSICFKNLKSLALHCEFHLFFMVQRHIVAAFD